MDSTKEDIGCTKENQSVCNATQSVTGCDKDVSVAIAEEINEDFPVIFPDDYFNPDKTVCPHCKNFVKPVVHYEMGFLPFLVMCFMVMTCIFALLSWLPLTNKTLKTIIHFCPTCNREIWRLTRM